MWFNGWKSCSGVGNRGGSNNMVFPISLSNSRVYFYLPYLESCSPLTLALIKRIWQKYHHMSPNTIQYHWTWRDLQLSCWECSYFDSNHHPPIRNAILKTSAKFRRLWSWQHYPSGQEAANTSPVKWGNHMGYTWPTKAPRNWSLKQHYLGKQIRSVTYTTNS